MYNADVIVGIIVAMVKHLKMSNRQLFSLLGYLLVTAVIWLTVMFEFRLDDSFITYRYARNLIEGVGLVYNPGDNVLSTTAPLYAILLAVLNIFIRDFHILGSLISVLSIGFGGWFVHKLLPDAMPYSIRLWAGLVYVLSSLLWLSVGMETALWIMMVLAAIDLCRAESWGWAGLCIGLAILTRADAILPGILLGTTALVISVNRISTTHHGWRPFFRFALAGFIPFLIFVVWAWVTYGSPFPATLSAKSAQAVLGISGLGLDVDMWEGLRLILRSLMQQSPLYVVLALLLLFGMAGSLSNSVVLIAVWSGLHLLAYIMLNVAPYRWYYAPLLPGAVVLAACGLYYLQQRLQLRGFRYGFVVVAAIALFPLMAQISSFTKINQYLNNGGAADVMLPVVDWDAYRQTGEWLEQNTPADATVGVAEVGQVGFYAHRWMTDYLGLLQPDVTASLRRGDLYSWLVGYAPDYLVFQRFRGIGLVLYNLYIQDDPWFKVNYQPVVDFDDSRYTAGPVTIFARNHPQPALVSENTQLEFGNLQLVGFASDGATIPSAGGAVRVRLDWDVHGRLPSNLHIAVKGLDMAGSNPGFDGDYDTSNWSGRFSTWHGFVVPASPPGQYKLLVSVGPRGGPYQDEVLGNLQVSTN
jgi:arabinofuranosyltransferase